MAIKFLSGLNLSGITTGSLLKLDSNGDIVAAVAGTDYATSSSAVWSTSGSNPTTAYYNGRVRVGTYQASVEASAKLHVFDYQTTDPKLLIEDGNTGDASMQFKISTQSYVMGIDNSDSDKFKLSASTAFGTSDVLTISSGNVGVGTTSPGENLTVIGNNAVFKAASVTADTGLPTKRLAEFAGIYNSGSNGHQMFISSTAGTGSWEINQTKTWGGIMTFGVSSNGTEITRHLAINSSGNVGIGTTSPNEKLHVAGDSVITGGLAVGEHTSIDANSFVIDAYRSSTATSGDSIGLHTLRYQWSGTNTGRIIGTYSAAQTSNTSTLTTAIGVYGTARHQSSGTLTNAYSLYLDSPSGSPTNAYNIYAAGSANNYIGGSLGIGTTSPLVGLDVRGTAIITNSAGNNYNENLRLPQATSGYAALTLGGSVAASGASAAQWTILKYPTNNDFAIRNNQSDKLYITTSGTVKLLAYGAGLLKTNASGEVSLDTNTYLTTTSASSTYLPLTGGTVANGNTAIPLTISRTSATSLQVGIRFLATDGESEPTDQYFGAGTDAEPYWATTANLSVGNMIWHEGNDGAGSGLDADTLDGYHASSFLTAEADTLSSVTGRGASTATALTLSATAPLNMTAGSNTGTYNKTVYYYNQNNTSGSATNGVFIERGRITDSASAEVRNFVIGSRGGQIQWRVNGTGSTEQSGDLVLSNSASPTIYLTSNNATTGKNWTIKSRNDGYFLIGRHNIANDMYFDPSGNANFAGALSVSGTTHLGGSANAYTRFGTYGVLLSTDTHILHNMYYNNAWYQIDNTKASSNIYMGSSSDNTIKFGYAGAGSTTWGYKHTFYNDGDYTAAKDVTVGAILYTATVKTTNAATVIDNSGIQPDQGTVEDIVKFKWSGTQVASVDTGGYVNATGFKTSGTTGFLKSDGSVDTSSYISSIPSEYVTDTELTTALGSYLTTSSFNSAVAFVLNGTDVTMGDNVTLGSAAFSATTDFAAASHTHSYLPLSGGTLTGTLIVPTIEDSLYNHGGSDAWYTKRYTRNLGISGSAIGDSWVHLARIAIGDTYRKLIVKFTIHGFDDVSSGTEVIDGRYENGSTAQEAHGFEWYSTDNNANLFKEVRSIRSSSSGLSNTYDIWVQMAGDWRDTFTVDAEYWTYGGGITFMTTSATATEPSAGSDDKQLTSRTWRTQNAYMYLGGNRILTTADEGSGNGLDADTVDGQDGSYYLNYNNFTNTPTLGTAASSASTDFVAVTGDTMTGSLTIDTGTIGSTTQAYTAFDRLIFNNQYSDVARGANKIILYDDGSSWMGGFGIHDDTVAYYTGGTHKWYKVSSNSTYTERMTLDASGNLSIDGSLSVGGATFVDANRRNIYLDSFDASGGAGIFFRDGFTYNASITAEDHNGSSADGICISGYDGVSFSTGANTRNERMRIASNGNVGIGTTSPSHKLDIYSNENVPLRIHRPSNANLDSSGAWGIGFSTRGDAINSTTDTRAGIFSYYNGNLFLAAANTSIVADPDAYARLTVLNTGYVGIGTSSPTTKLEVNGSFKSTGIQDASNALTVFINGNNEVGIGTTSPSQKLDINQGHIKVQSPNVGGIIPPSLTIGQVVNAYQAGISSTGHATVTAASNVYLRTGGSNYALTALSGGDVGIGTTSPSYKLDVNGSTRISGILRTTDPVFVNNRSGLSVAHWSASGNTTGAIRITLPGSHTGNWSMLVLRITAYEYSGNRHCVYYVSGHDWTSGWYNFNVTKIGKSDKDIKVGYDGTANKDYVVIGGTSSSWSYGHVTVDVVAHPSFYSGNMDITSGWDIRQTTDLSGITLQTTNNDQVWDSGNDGSGSGLDADTVDGIQASSFLRSDANDSFSGNLTSASTGWIKFSHTNETDSNDGKIGSGVFASGLNIVGTQTVAGTGRQVRIWGSLIDSGGGAYATQTYVDNAVAAIVDQAPQALDTLNELAAALGDDAAFSTTVSTALGNRLRIDTNAQNLTATEKSNAYTNLDLANNFLPLSGVVLTVNGTDYSPGDELGAADLLAKIKTVDGSTSGLDADLLDGIDSGSFLRSDANDTYTGTLTVSGTVALGELRMGTHPYHTAYTGLWNTEASTTTTQQYMIISAGSDTYINGDSVYIRAGNNSTSNELRVTTTGVTVGGNKVLTESADLTTYNIAPAANTTYDLGRDTGRWRVVYCETLDSAGIHEANLANKKTGLYATGTVLVWKDGQAIPSTSFADYMKIGIAVYGNSSPLVHGAEPVLCTGQVEEGDYLVTSTETGHAMALTRQEVRERNLMDCVIGKALESGDGNSHLIKTWLTI